jgi:hypothetical protein
MDSDFRYTGISFYLRYVLNVPMYVPYIPPQDLQARIPETSVCPEQIDASETLLPHERCAITFPRQADMRHLSMIRPHPGTKGDMISTMPWFPYCSNCEPMASAFRLCHFSRTHMPLRMMLGRWCTTNSLLDQPVPSNPDTTGFVSLDSLF